MYSPISPIFCVYQDTNTYNNISKTFTPSYLVTETSSIIQNLCINPGLHVHTNSEPTYSTTCVHLYYLLLVLRAFCNSHLATESWFIFLCTLQKFKVICTLISWHTSNGLIFNFHTCLFTFVTFIYATWDCT